MERKDSGGILELTTMTAIEKIKQKPLKYPPAQYTANNAMITVEPADSDGFEVCLISKRPGYTIAFDGWHEEFDDEDTALNAFAMGLSEGCRLQVIQYGGRDCVWILEYLDETGQWLEDSRVGLLHLFFWMKKKVVYRQNHLIAGGSQANPDRTRPKNA